MSDKEKTLRLLLKQCDTYKGLEAEDIFKYLFQSAFGCEHLVSNEDDALSRIMSEYNTVNKTDPPLVEPLDGEYSRVHLSCLNSGLRAETLARLFVLSAKKEAEGKKRLLEKLEIARTLAEAGKFPFDSRVFSKRLEAWKESDFGALHHSELFRSLYHPAYRVMQKRLADLLPVFTAVDLLPRERPVIIAVEGGSASGKTTLAKILEEVFCCSVFHMDDFFLRPEQRTPQRLDEIGGNVDRERFEEEVLRSLKKNETVVYRPFDCGTQTLGEEVSVAPNRMSVVEGVYSTHPAFSRYYDLALFLDIDPECQKKRILIRNSPSLAERFFNEWIPLENKYFYGTDIKRRSDLIFSVSE